MMRNTFYGQKMKTDRLRWNLLQYHKLKRYHALNPENDQWLQAADCKTFPENFYSMCKKGK